MDLRCLYRGFRDTVYLPFYFNGYRILSILLLGIWDTGSNSLVTFRDIEYLGKLIMWIFARFGILACLLQEICDIWYPPIQASFKTKSYITTRRKVHVINGLKRTWWVTQVSLATSTRKHRKKARCIEQVLSFHLNAL